MNLEKKNLNNEINNLEIYKRFLKKTKLKKEFEEITYSMFIKKMNKQQVSRAMSEIKWLFRSYPGLEVLSLQDEKGNITRFEL